MLTLINKWLTNYYREHRKFRTFRPLLPCAYDVFKKYGEGLYICCLQAVKSDIVSRLIGMVTGQMSHVAVVLYAETKTAWLTAGQYTACCLSYMGNYAWTTPYFTDAKTVVLSSADSTGLECFDFSAYQGRKLSLRKIPATKDQAAKIIDVLVSNIGRPYDFTGLLGWLFRTGDDAYSYYCSEIVFDACMEAGLRIAGTDAPSVDDIENYEDTREWVVFRNF